MITDHKSKSLGFVDVHGIVTMQPPDFVGFVGMVARNSPGAPQQSAVVCEQGAVW